MFFAPYVVPSAAMALIWTWLYTPQIGLWDTWLSAVGISSPPNWLADPDWAMDHVALATVWWTLGFNFVLYLAGLQEIPRELYEAAAIDGAEPVAAGTPHHDPAAEPHHHAGAGAAGHRLAEDLRPDLPHDQRAARTTRPGSLLEYVYDIGFTDFRTGYAAAASMLFFLVILAVSRCGSSPAGASRRGHDR